MGKLDLGEAISRFAVLGLVRFISAFVSGPTHKPRAYSVGYFLHFVCFYGVCWYRSGHL